MRTVTAGKPAEAPSQPADVDARTGSARRQPLKPHPSFSYTSGLHPGPAATDSAPRVARGPPACSLLCLKAGAPLHASLNALLTNETTRPLGGDIYGKVERLRKMYVIFFFFSQGACGTPSRSLSADPGPRAVHGGGCSSPVEPALRYWRPGSEEKD